MIRRKSPMVLAATVASAAVFFAAGGDVHPSAAGASGASIADGKGPWHFELVEAKLPGSSSMNSYSELAVASRLAVDRASRILPVGVANEQRLQVRTILTARNISAAFPQIHEIGGYRPDALRWHPVGLALDVMIPNPKAPTASRWETKSSRMCWATRIDSGYKTQFGVAFTTRPTARDRAATATTTTFTSPPPAADTRPAEKSTCAEPRYARIGSSRAALRS